MTYTGDYITPIMRLAAVAAAARAGYDFAASEVTAIEGDTYEFATADGYHYWISEQGEVHSDAPWQLRA